MSDSSEITSAIAGTEPAAAALAGTELAPAGRRGRMRRMAERGLTTVEYAIGLLAAAAVALVLLRIFNDNAFFKMLFDWVVQMFTNAASAQ